MSALMPPPVAPSDEQDDVEALIREARARQRRRRLLAAAGVAVVAAGALAASSALGGGGGSATKRGDGGRAVVVTSLPRCRSGQLRLTAPKQYGAAAGTAYEDLTVVNTSRSSCVLGGWPAVRRFDRAGKAIPLQVYRDVYKQRGPAPYREVPLRPGAAATANLSGGDLDRGGNGFCSDARTIEVRPSGGGAWLSMRRTFPACTAWALGPFVPGRVSDPPNFGLSQFYVSPTPQRPFYSGRMNRTSWRLRVRDSGDGRYCFSVVTDGVPRGGRCGRMIGHEEPGKLGWIASNRGPSFVAGAVVSAATHMGITLSNGSAVYPRTMRPTRPLAPGISFFFTMIPRGTHPVSLRGRTDRGGHVVEWPPEP